MIISDISELLELRRLARLIDVTIPTEDRCPMDEWLKQFLAEGPINSQIDEGGGRIRLVLNERGKALLYELQKIELSTHPERLS